MFTFIIIAVVVIVFVVGFMKNLTKEEKQIVTRRTINASTYGITLSVKGVKSTSKAIFQAGQLAGIEMALNNQAALAAMRDKDLEVQAKGGAVKTAVVDFNSMCKSIGIDTVNTDLSKTIEHKKALLAEARANL